MATRKKRTTKRPAGETGSTGERDTSGRFLPGNTTSRKGGNPQIARLARYRKAISDACTPNDLRCVVQRLVKAANAGDVQAAKVLMDRVVGKVKAAPEPIDLGIDSLDSVQDIANASRLILAAMLDGRLSPDDGAKMAAVAGLTGVSAQMEEFEARLRAFEEEEVEDEA